MKNKILLTTVSVVAALSAANSIAGGAPGRVTDAYVTTTKGQIVRDIKGDCVRTTSWKPALALPECEGKKIPVAVRPKPAPQPEFVSVALKAGALFDVDKAVLKPQGKDRLAVLARRIKASVNTDLIRVEGHTDSTGSDAHNQRLSERRAAAVKNYLVSQGIPASKIETIGYGESRPIASNATKIGRAKNRRVVVKIRATKQVR